jgi:hypothetical protein
MFSGAPTTIFIKDLIGDIISLWKLKISEQLVNGSAVKLGKMKNSLPLGIDDWIIDRWRYFSSVVLSSG